MVLLSVCWSQAAGAQSRFKNIKEKRKSKNLIYTYRKKIKSFHSLYMMTFAGGRGEWAGGPGRLGGTAGDRSLATHQEGTETDRQTATEQQAVLRSHYGLVLFVCAWFSAASVLCLCECVRERVCVCVCGWVTGWWVLATSDDNPIYVYAWVDNILVITQVLYRLRGCTILL